MTEHSVSPPACGTPGGPVPAGAAREPADSSRARGWLVFAALVVLEGLLFRRFALQEVTWAYPCAWDQATYLCQSYEIYERMRATGPFGAAWKALREPSPNGVLLPVQAAVLFLLLGPGRLTALSLNFLYFALFQGVLLDTLRRLSGRWSVGFLGVGLLLTASSPLFWAGGLADFRIDFAALCLFGTFLSLVARSGFLVSRRHALAAGVAGAALIVLRPLTSVYLGGILGGFVVIALVGKRLLAGCLGEEDRACRRGVVYLGVALGVLSLPCLWHSRRVLWAYYVGAHLGAEKPYRVLERGVRGWSDALLFYPRALLSDHLGAVFGALAVLVVLLGLGVRLWRGASAGGVGPGAFRRGLLFLALAVLWPLTVLTLNPTKNPVVVNVLVAPLLWLALLPLLWAAPKSPSPSKQRRCGSEGSGAGRPDRGIAVALGVAACVAVAAGLFVQADALGRQAPLGPVREDAAEVNRLYDLIGERAVKAGLRSPRLSVDSVVDYLFYAAVKAGVYERQGVLLDVRPALGRAILPVPEAEALAEAGASDFVILSSAPGPETEAYPFNVAIRAVRPRLRAKCEREFLRLATVRVYGREQTLYMRARVRAEAEPDGWVSSAGLTVSCPADVLRSFPVVRLRGTFDPDWLRAFPHAEAGVEGEVGRPAPRPRVWARVEGNAYTLVVGVAPEGVPPAGEVRLRLSFDRSFVPREIGLGADARRLVIRAPAAVECFRTPGEAGVVGGPRARAAAVTGR